MKLHYLFEQKNIKDILLKNGLKLESISSKMKMFQNSTKKLSELGYSDDCNVFAYFVPGRLEVLGKHTDYAGGNSLICAADRGFCITSVSRNDNLIRVFNTGSGDNTVFDLSKEIEAQKGSWENYPANVLRRLKFNFGDDIKGCDIAFDSDLPLASGMSSSSALIIAMFFAVAGANDLFENSKFKSNIENKIHLAEYLANIENGLTFRELEGRKGVGTFGGSEDHTAIINCKPGKVSEFSYCPIEFQREIQIPENYRFVIASSGVHAVKTGNAMESYNLASKLVQTLLKMWNENKNTSYADLNSAITSSDFSREELYKIIENSDDKIYSNQQLIERFEHFYSENYEIIPEAIIFFNENSIQKFAKAVDRSQKLTSELLKNQVEQTEFLTKSAKISGAVTASSFGAGFGGSVWSLVNHNKLSEFIENWKTSYQEKYPEEFSKSEFFTINAGPAAFKLDFSS